MLSERSRNILSAIVQDYILTAEPVGSRTIALNHALALSPATIRNIMAELEVEGYLTHPHTSAGRVPTDMGFRLYLDVLKDTRLREPEEKEKDILKNTCAKGQSTEGILSDTAKTLSTLTSCAGLMFFPKRENFVIRQINLLPVDGTSLIVLLVSSLGMVDTRRIRMGFDIGGLDLTRVSNYLNSMAGGLTIAQLRAKIVDEMQKEKNLYDELLKNALRLGALALQGDGGAEGELYVEGKVNIFGQPEFRDDFERMKKLFAAFEEKSLLVRILDKSSEEAGIHICLGSDLVKEFEGLSFVTAPYSRDGEVLGTLGVIGPVRMNYSRIIPLVDYTAGLLGRVL